MPENDYTAAGELAAIVRQARDRAHWLSVHRRMRLAGHIEDLLSAVLRMCFELQETPWRGDA